MKKDRKPGDMVMVLVKPYSGPNHLVLFFKDGADVEHSPVRAIYFGWSREVDGWYLEVSNSGSRNIDTYHYETKEKMERAISHITGVDVVVTHDGHRLVV